MESGSQKYVFHHDINKARYEVRTKQLSKLFEVRAFRIERCHSQFMFVVAVVILLRVSSTIGEIACYFLIAAYAAAGSRQTLEAFLLSWFVTMINPAIAPPLQFGEVGRYIVILSASMAHFLRFLYRLPSIEIYRSTFFILVLSIFMLLHSALLSHMPTVSFFKSIIWLLVIVNIVVATNRLDDIEIATAQRNIYSFISIVLCAGVFLLPTSAGFFRNGVGFQGFLNHPQVFGAVAAILATRCLAVELQRSRFNVINLTMIFALTFLVFLSQTRTALLALIISLIFGFALTIFQTKRSRRKMAGVFSTKGLFFLGIISVAVISNWSTLSTVVKEFLSKGTDAQRVSLVNQYETSRGILLDRAIENIRDYPISGVGFGVPSLETKTQPTLDPLFGIPISFPVEKGNAFFAIIEETGFILGGFILLWLGIRLFSSVRYGLSAIMVASFCLASNVGEAVIFSPGGQGMLILLLFFMSTQRKIVA